MKEKIENEIPTLKYNKKPKSRVWMHEVISWITAVTPPKTCFGSEDPRTQIAIPKQLLKNDIHMIVRLPLNTGHHKNEE